MANARPTARRARASASRYGRKQRTRKRGPVAPVGWPAGCLTHRTARCVSVRDREQAVSDKRPIVNFSEFDVNRALADAETIRRYNPQRHEMEQLTAIVHEDLERNVCVGYKDVTRDEFWVRGHMPGMPLLPGVLMCEAAAQLASYYTQKNDLLGTRMVGFGGLEDVRFRDPVIPGDRLIVMVELLKLRRGRMVVCRFQGWVRQSLAVDGIIKGIPLPDLPDSLPGGEA
jgi:3-hydroxyacyl-[acyl-carrier-protein] dehydratase